MQEENLKIVQPLTLYMERQKGWYVKKFHGSQFQSGVPDLLAMHPKYTPKWIECKVIRHGDFSFTIDQEREFPIWIANGVDIWVVAGHDFRYPHGKDELERAYNSLFTQSNCALYLNPRTRRTLLR